MTILNLNAEILWVFLNLAILLLLMKKFLFGPVTRMLDERSKEISDNIQGAQARMDEANQTKAEYEAHLLAAKKEAQAILDQARKQAQADYEAKMEQARQDISRLQAAAQQQAQADKDAMLAQARQQIAMLALMAASKVSQQNMNADADQALGTAFLSEVEEHA